MVKRAKCIIVLSGGPDSAVVAYWAKNKGYDVYGLTFNYGQISIKEIGCARKIAAKLSIPIKIIDLSSLKDIFAGVTSLVDENIQMTTDFSQPIIVPFRNAIFLSVAVAYAISINSKYIFYGAQGSDAQHYPDCRKEFYNSFEQTARLGTNEELEIEAPFSNVPKSETIKLGTKLGVPFHLTWSCYLNLPKHCGKCESCINRKNAFKQSGLTDPTEYIE
ncbi:MAG: 7-cyano-7-deazaguanine synthase QueC [Candidatus Bathyarchaeia archaeon]